MGEGSDRPLTVITGDRKTRERRVLADGAVVGRQRWRKHRCPHCKLRQSKRSDSPCPNDIWADADFLANARKGMLTAPTAVALSTPAKLP
jgi:hypothetical protein